MPIRLDELSKEHEMVRAAYAMVAAHSDYETALPALEDIQAQFPNIEPEHLVILWIGINAKDREG